MSKEINKEKIMAELREILDKRCNNKTEKIEILTLTGRMYLL